MFMVTFNRCYQNLYGDLQQVLTLFSGDLRQVLLPRLTEALEVVVEGLQVVGHQVHGVKLEAGNQLHQLWDRCTDSTAWIMLFASRVTWP